MLNASEISEAIASAILFVANNQDYNGGFTSTSYRLNEPNTVMNHQTVYYPGLIASLLENSPGSEAKIIIEKIHEFIISQKNRWWTFNYWSKTDQAYEHEPYPDDLDDTCLALTILSQNKNKGISGQALANLVMTLTGNEVNPGGPYRTWIVSQPTNPPWNDVDIAVNASAAYCLKSQNIILPGLEHYFREIIVSNNYQSPYYYSKFFVLYLIARAVSPSLFPEIHRVITAESETIGSGLDLALYTSILILIQAPRATIDRSLQNLLDIHDDFRLDPVIIEKNQHNIMTVSGSKALTAAAYAHTFSLYEKHCIEKPKHCSPRSEEENIYDEIITQTAKLLPRESSFQNSGLKCLSAMAATPNIREITLASYHIQKALKIHLPDSLIIDLGVAHLLSALSYDILDACYDTGSVTSELTIAPILLREAINHYHTIAAQYTIDVPYIKKIFDAVDQSYAHEFNYNHISSKNRDDLRNQLVNYIDPTPLRSCGHTLGPKILLQIAGQQETNENNLSLFFTNYLTAKQISDNLHDWREDINNDLLTNVTQPILLTWCERHQPHEVFDVKKDMLELEKIFWSTTHNTLLQSGLYHINQARVYLTNISWTNEPLFFTEKLNRLKQTFTHTIGEYEKIKEFLEFYKI